MGPFSAPKYLPWASKHLSLSFEFDLSDVPDLAVMQQADHMAAIRTASTISGLLTPDEAAARSLIIDERPTLASAQAAPFDEEHSDGKTVHVDFFYSRDNSTSMSMRVLVDLSRCDGVTAARLALHTMEVLDGTSSIEASRFTKNTPLRYGLRHARNLLSVAGGALKAMARANLRTWWKATDADAHSLNINSVSALYQYYSSPGAPAAAYRTFAASGNLFKPFLRATESFRKQCGLQGYAYLVNFSPLVSVGFVRTQQEMLSPEGRLNGCFAPVGPPPSGPASELPAAVHSSSMLVNNYGRHQHTFKAKPVGFVWDWLNFPAVTVSGCISINGVFMSFVRGSPGAIVLCDSGQYFQAELGATKYEFAQSAERPIDTWAGAAPPKAAAVATKLELAPNLGTPNVAALALTAGAPAA